MLVSFLTSVNSQAICLDSPQWPIQAIRAESALKGPAVSLDLKVAVIDTGIDRNHPAFKKSKILGKDFVGDQTQAPYPYFDKMGHGTHVAGIIAGVDCQGLPIGLATGATLIVARVCGEVCKSEDVAAGISWAVSEGAQVINVSLEGGGLAISPLEIQAVKNAIEKGVAVVTISGNGGSLGNNNSIAEIDGVIVVGAVNQWLEKPFFSQTGLQTLAAPGVNILSAYPQGSGYLVHGVAENSEMKTALNLLPLLNTPQPQKIKSQLVDVGTGDEGSMGLVAGKIALAKQGGGVGIDDKAKNAERAGAKAIIIMLSRPFFAVGLQTLDTFTIPVLFAPLEDEESLQEMVRENVLIAIDTQEGDYVLESGTSMAAPFVTGAIGLLKHRKPILSSFEIRDLLIRSATRSDLNRSPNQDSPFGAGVLNVEKLLEISGAQK